MSCNWAIVSEKGIIKDKHGKLMVETGDSKVDVNPKQNFVNFNNEHHEINLNITDI